MKILLTIAGLINGGFMLLDGIYVYLIGKYIGPEKPGPWAALFYKLNLDVFKLGWLFILFGMLWLIWLYGLWTNRNWVFVYGMVISMLTLWYVPVGSFFSLTVITILWIYRKKSGK